MPKGVEHAQPLCPDAGGWEQVKTSLMPKGVEQQEVREPVDTAGPPEIRVYPQLSAPEWSSPPAVADLAPVAQPD